MPMPHRTQLQIIKRRLTGKEGSEKTRELRAILAELPGYRNGPYADIRKWVQQQIEETHARASVLQRDSIAVRREGVAQIALVGPPNAGKSSLLQALSHIQIKVGDYAFTTLRPVPALTRIHGLLVQIVEIPGLIEGAADDRGGGRALLGVLRGADGIVFCQDASDSTAGLERVLAEVGRAEIRLPAILAATKLDDASATDIHRIAEKFSDLTIVPVSILDDDTVDRLKDAIWSLTGLARIILRRPGDSDGHVAAIAPGATVLDVARHIHHEVAASCTGARIWGPSSRFDGQQVGTEHVVADGDTIEILRTR